jgi:glyoxylase-like metal-dependent hydrolase (beta-lactamase superfamily II)
MTLQLSLTSTDLAPIVETASGARQFAPDLSYSRFMIVNVIFYGNPASEGGWTLIDTGLPTSARTIIKVAKHRFGKDARPTAIIMTHAHFDHAGSLETLADYWDVPVYAHPLEAPYLSGEASYPPADPMVGGGAVALLSPVFPRSPVDVRARLRNLPFDQSVPGMPGWTWIHTPGHMPGHVSLWREKDRTLIAGDAIVTTGQESIYEVITQQPEIHGPPRYLTAHWEDAENSVQLLASLEPELLISGHGQPVKGGGMRERLHQLAADFQAIAVPPRGRYAIDPAKPGKHDNDAYR